MIEKCFTNSTIIMCEIKKGEEIITTKKKYRSIVVDLWKSTSIKDFFTNTKFNFKLENMQGSKGYNWCPDISLSFQSKDANGTMEEIINMININGYKATIVVQMEDKKILKYQI